MNTLQKKRLLKLADFVAKRPRHRFYFGQFAGTDWKGAKDLSCGTSACALGWATAMPLFQKLGLKLRKSKWPTYFHVSRTRSMKIFGLTRNQWETLFIPGYGLDGDATQKDWARHARKFVKEYEKQN